MSNQQRDIPVLAAEFTAALPTLDPYPVKPPANTWRSG